MMKKELITAVVNEVQRLAPNMEVSVHDVVKNNDVTLHGIVIKEEGSNISPAIYIENYFKDGVEPSDLNNVAKNILETYYSHQNEADQYNHIVSKISNFNAMRALLRIRLVNKKLNENLLKTTPYMPFLDMAIIAVIELCDTDNGLATIKITNQLLKSWGKTFTDILLYANRNTFNVPYTLKSMAEIMAEMLDVPQEIIDIIAADSPMYVLSNKTNVNGATMICNYDVMTEIANKLDADLIVLPSSVHEVIIVPMRNGMNVTEMTRMVREINSSEVEPEDVLSDHAYIFTRKNGWEF